MFHFLTGELLVLREGIPLANSKMLEYPMFFKSREKELGVASHGGNIPTLHLRPCAKSLVLIVQQPEV